MLTKVIITNHLEIVESLYVSNLRKINKRIWCFKTKILSFCFFSFFYFLFYYIPFALLPISYYFSNNVTKANINELGISCFLS